MLVNGDVSGLEVVVAAQLSRDSALMEEVRQKVNFHLDNQNKFGLPDRVTAKRFIFKLLYGATAYGFSVDGDFKLVGYSEKQWQEVIDRFYEKYRGIYNWHNNIIADAKRNRRLEIPSGRYFPFEPKAWRGELQWPLTTIKNYPIQGFGADLVKLARLECKQLLNEAGLKDVLLVCTIHDSIVVDTPSHNLDAVAKILLQCVQSVPALCKKVWDYDFDLPLTAEVQYGKNKGEMVDYKFDKV